MTAGLVRLFCFFQFDSNKSLSHWYSYRGPCPRRWQGLSNLSISYSKVSTFSQTSLTDLDNGFITFLNALWMMVKHWLASLVDCYDHWAWLLVWQGLEWRVSFLKWMVNWVEMRMFLLFVDLLEHISPDSLSSYDGNCCPKFNKSVYLFYVCALCIYTQECDHCFCVPLLCVCTLYTQECDHCWVR